ncbi:MAG: hypothetical protein HY931_02955 [Candidatus Falkowbacteria bacterium]|nr:MAG: hypothetical protein HY931_02955 [Candidatus Falkowbacteria bacterium]
MKNLVLVFIAIIAFSVSGCQFKSHKLEKAEAPKVAPAKVAIPIFSVEKRAEKYALFFKGRLASSFKYDSINIKNTYPILIEGVQKYVFLTTREKIFGPFDEALIINEKNIKISVDGRKKNGFLYSNGEQQLFNYPKVDQDSHNQSLYWLTTKSGQKGLLSTGYAVKEELLVLPFGDYLFTDLSTNSSGYENWSDAHLDIRFFKKTSFGKAYSGLHSDGMDTQYRNGVKETKLKDLFGYNAKIVSVNAAKNALVSSEKGYGLINLDGVILVPAAYTAYQKLGDSAYIFSTANETLKVDLKGKKI